jgi:hypothetical protein
MKSSLVTSGAWQLFHKGNIGPSCTRGISGMLEHLVKACSPSRVLEISNGMYVV